MRLHRSLLGLGVLAAFTLTGSARADAPARRLVARLASALRGHALADESGRIPLLTALPPGVSAEQLGLLEVAPGFGAVHLPPDQLDAFAALHPELSLRVSPPRHLLLDRSRTWTRVGEYRDSTCARGAGVVVGVIDTGLDLRHADFRNVDGTTRVAWLMKAGPPHDFTKELGDLEEKFGCTKPNQSACAIFDRAAIDAMLVTNDDLLPHDPQGHGTHVTSIAAGNGGLMRYALPRQLGGDCDPDSTGDACDKGACVPFGCRHVCTAPCVSKADCPGETYCGTIDEQKMCVPRKPVYVGVAPEATIIVAAPSSGVGFANPDILNAAKFIFDRAAALGMPAVINLSVGGDFGPHDGTSALEKGLAALVGDDKPGRAIVVAAGNSGALYRIGETGPLGIHTEAHVTAHGKTRVPILAPGAKSGQGFVWVTFRAGDKVSVGLEGPGGETWVGLVDPGDDGGYQGDDGSTGAVINALVNGKSSITSDTNSAVVAWDGKWDDPSEFAVVMEGEGDAELWVVGQGDVAPGASAGLQFERAIRQGTINVPASHPGLLAVGCTMNRIKWPTETGEVMLGGFGPDTPAVEDTVCYFSSAGPTPSGWPKPEISAPGGFVAAAMSEDADPRKNPGGLFDAPGCDDAQGKCYVVDNYHAITAGSSMSAPHVAGAVALLMQKDPTLTQGRATEVLQAGARYPSQAIRYDYQLGTGELDMVGAVAALAEQEAHPVAADPSLSWYVLSSGYARPDRTWPVYGTIELRRSDGTIASGLDGSALGISIQNGELVQPITKVRHGMFRFAVAGTPGSVGRELSLDVLYGGQSLGVRKLPIGTDVFTGNGQLDATSGACSCRVTGGDESRTWEAVVLLASGAGIAAARRRSRGAGSRASLHRRRS